MVLHPLLLAVLLCDFLGLYFLTTAVVQTFAVLDDWQPVSSTSRQLTLERRVEMAGVYAQLTLGCLGVGGLLLLMAICHHLPSLVPGAMCGTGVLQASGLPGWRALGFRGVTLMLLVAARLISHLNQNTPTAPLAKPLVRALIVALPAYAWTLWDTARAFLSLAPQAPVSCCAVVYSQVGGTTDSGGLLHRLDTLPAPMLTGLLALTSALLLLLLPHIRDRHGITIRAQRIGYALMAITALWLPLAGAVLITRFAAYHFEVLAHHCPWCLFLPEHRLVGYPLLAAFIILATEAPIPWLAGRLALSYPQTLPAAVRRLKQVPIRMVIALVIYWLVGGLPVLAWRLRYGVWMG